MLLTYLWKSLWPLSMLYLSLLLKIAIGVKAKSNASNILDFNSYARCSNSSFPNFNNWNNLLLMLCKIKVGWNWTGGFKSKLHKWGKNGFGRV
jgi:hypothetical protein